MSCMPSGSLICSTSLLITLTPDTTHVCSQHSSFLLYPGRASDAQHTPQRHLKYGSSSSSSSSSSSRSLRIPRGRGRQQQQEFGPLSFCRSLRPPLPPVRSSGAARTVLDMDPVAAERIAWRESHRPGRRHEGAGLGRVEVATRARAAGTSGWAGAAHGVALLRLRGREGDNGWLEIVPRPI
jgi:hypothetical protein